MSAILVITGVALLALPGVVASRAGRLRPDEWRRLNRAAIWLGFAMAALGLVATAVPLAWTQPASTPQSTAATTCWDQPLPAPRSSAVRAWP